MRKCDVLRKASAFFLCVIIFCCSLSCLTFSQEKINSFPNTSGASYIYLYNYESNSVVYSKGNLTSKISPASTVKLMSGYLALNYLGDRLDETVEITSDMLRDVEGFTVGIKVGDVVKIEDILYSLICGSGNDAAHVVANLCCGGIDEFVNRMNTVAKDLGMTNTNYTNPTGLDDNNSYTTVEDTAIISKINAENDQFVKISTTGKYTYIPLNDNIERTIYNRNALHSTFSASGYKSSMLKGLNAGSTDNGGYCLSAYADDGQDSYLCIVMGGKQETNGVIASYQIANDLVEYYYENYTYTIIAKKGDKIAKRPVDLALPTNGNDSVYVNVIIDSDIFAFAPKNIDYKNDLTYKTYYHTDIFTAPLIKGTVVGGTDIYFEDEYITSSKIILDSDIPESRLLVFLERMKQAMISRISIIFVVLFIPSILAFFYITEWRKKISAKKNNRL